MLAVGMETAALRRRRRPLRRRPGSWSQGGEASRVAAGFGAGLRGGVAARSSSRPSPPAAGAPRNATPIRSPQFADRGACRRRPCGDRIDAPRCNGSFARRAGSLGGARLRVVAAVVADLLPAMPRRSLCRARSELAELLARAPSTEAQPLWSILADRPGDGRGPLRDAADRRSSCWRRRSRRNGLRREDAVDRRRCWRRPSASASGRCGDRCSRSRLPSFRSRPGSRGWRRVAAGRAGHRPRR